MCVTKMIAFSTRRFEAETAHYLARMGYGLIQAPRYRFREDLAQGARQPPPLPLAPNAHRTANRRRMCGFLRLSGGRL